MELNEKTLEKILDNQRKEYQDYIGVLKEDFDSKVQLITEQYDSIRETLDEHSTILQEHSTILQEHSTILQEHSTILREHSQRFTSIGERLTSIEENIEIMKTDTIFIKNGLKQKVDLEEFQTLEKRVILLETKVSGRR